jgi:hypothetical protein
MPMVRTYFLCHIVNGEERRYNLDSSVTSCLGMLHCPTKNLTRRFVAPELFSRESFLSQQQDLKRADLFFLETLNRLVPTHKEE